jgi:NADPH-dependent glutamate synthase beta subunit-like oxidoreductase/NAD(P)H-flavin reductase
MNYNITNTDIAELYHYSGIKDFNRKFYQQLLNNNPQLYQNLDRYYCNNLKITLEDIIEDRCNLTNILLDQDNCKLGGDLLIELAKFVEHYLANFFLISQEVSLIKDRDLRLQNIYFVKREFVQRIIAKKFNNITISQLNILENFDYRSMLSELDIAVNYSNIDIDFIEENIANKIYQIIANIHYSEQIIDKIANKFNKINIITPISTEQYINQNLKKDFDNDSKELLEKLSIYTIWALFSNDGKSFHKNGSLFKLPQKIDYDNLVKKSEINLIKRRGFSLTDQGFSNNQVLGNANYCIFCHKQEKDYCRKGIVESKQIIDDNCSNNNQKLNNFRHNPLGQELTGCPLDQQISEMNYLKANNYNIAALTVITIDNPMVAATGNRICNDCSKSCIFQKQDPVDIPQIETRILKDVLNLEFGFEIYSLLTRWNPCRILSPMIKPTNNKKILVCGLGPAGFTLANYLINNGNVVVAIDGLKIEPLNPELCGVNIDGTRSQFKAIKDINAIYQNLEERVNCGFGGVMSYGITARFDKNFLTIIRIILQRRANFAMFGGLRFGSSITEDSAFNHYNFDHIALAIGTGKPQIMNWQKNNFCKGVRMASDFLMNLHLGSPFKESLFTNLQIRMPAIIIGGGLTAIDAACEVRAYYQRQVTKFANQYQKIIKIIGEEALLSRLSDEEKIIAKEFITDSKRADLSKYLNDNKMIQIFYRKRMQDCPAYKTNHQELINAIAEGVNFVENTSVEEVYTDEFGHIAHVVDNRNQEIVTHCLIIAIGTLPNISISENNEVDIATENGFFATVNNEKINNSKVFYKNHLLNFIVKFDNKNNKAISYFGDLHPIFTGSVVKAMASAKIGVRQILNLLNNDNLCNIDEDINNNNLSQFFKIIYDDFRSVVAKVEKIADNCFEINIKAPLIANHSKVGQIFRFKNFSFSAKRSDNKILSFENLPTTALEVDKKAGIIKAMIFEYGASSKLIANLNIGEDCVFMGPSGIATELPSNKNILLIANGRGNQAITAFAAELKKQGSVVNSILNYQNSNQIVDYQKIIANSDEYWFHCDKSDEYHNIFDLSHFCNYDAGRLLSNAIAIFEQLKYDKINNIETINAKTTNKDDELARKLASKLGNIDHLIVIGNNKLISDIAIIYKQKLKHIFAKNHKAIASLNSPMQCMMKGICSQCLQKVRYPDGKIKYFYSCAKQDEDLEIIDLEHLKWRCEQNNLAEKISKISNLLLDESCIK